MPIALKAIIPKNLNVVPPITGIEGALKSWGTDMVQTMSQYPPWQPWKKAPKSGIRAGGKRTTALGKNWATDGPFNSRVRIWMIVANRVPYAGYVQGYKGKAAPRNEMQARALAARGWSSISDIAPIVWKRHLPNIRRWFKRR